MQIAVRSILGLCGVPKDRTSASGWLIKAGVKIVTLEGDARRPEAVNLSDLPPEVRRAVIERDIAAGGLPVGTYDEAAHGDFAEATPKMRDTAERKAAIARDLMTLGAQVTWAERIAILRGRHGEDGTSKPSLTRILKAVEGVDPINFAPALLADYCRAGAPVAEISDAAWSYFMTTIRDAGEQFPIIQAWRDVRDVAKRQGWTWPKYVTVWRRWTALSEAQRLEARHGREAAVKAIGQPILRDKTTLSPLQIVSLDGRTLDFWVDFGDGKPVRPVMITLVDVASNFILGYELTKSENAVATARLIRNVCRTHGIFDRLYTDNGSAFAGHLVAGGAIFKWRGKAKANAKFTPPGVCHHLGIDLTFAIPKNAQAKIAERTFAVLSRSIDDRPEFNNAHAGHGPGAAPDRSIVPVSLAVAESVLRREVDRHNREEGRRSQGARGRSYEQVFTAGIANRIPRRPTLQQLYYASLIYSLASVDRWGRVQVDTWTYGQPDTQAELLPWHGKGQIFFGRNPDDFDAPAVAFTVAGRLICKGVQPVKAGVYDSVEGAREASKNRKAARVAVDLGAKANDYLSDKDMAAALALLRAPEAAGTVSAPTVVGGRFGAPLQPKRRASAKGAHKTKSAITPEMMANFDKSIGFDRFLAKAVR